MNRKIDDFVLVQWIFDFVRLISSLLIAFFVIAFVRTWLNYRETSSNYLTLGNDQMPDLGARSVVCIVLLAGMIFALTKLLAHGVFSSGFSFIYRHRIAIAILFVAASTLFELSGSSISCLSVYLNETGPRGVLFGIPRAIRSDEWSVFTPFAFSQSFVDYSATNNLLRGVATDVTMVYAQPCWALPTLFRPFLWGYLFLGSSKGLAFFWSTRLAALFLTSEAFAKRLFGNSSKVSVAFASLVTFSGVVQWWYAVNGVAELFIFGQLLVICFDSLLNIEANRTLVRTLLSVLISWLAVSYIMVLYPAWQVVLFWVFLAIAIARAVAYLKAENSTLSLIKRLRPLLMSVLLIFGFVIACFIPSLEVVNSVGSTIYPGSRFNCGGGMNLVEFGNWARNLFSSLAASSQAALVYPDGFQTNVCEMASFFSIAPLGCVAGIITCISSIRHHRDVDGLIISLALVEVLLLAYCLFGLPRVLATVTLLGHSTERRVWQMTGYLDLILLFRLATTNSCVSTKNARNSFIALILLAAICSLSFSLIGQSARTLFRIGAALALFCFLSSLLGAGFKIRGSESCLVLIAALVVISGCTINPLQKGAPSLTDGETASALRDANESGDLWLSDSSMLGDLCIAEGAACLNSVNTYPAFEIWTKIDSSAEYKDCYNRYAHITVQPTNDKTSFADATGDRFTLQINLDDARKLGVTKWLTILNLSEFNTNDVKAVLVKQVGDYKIWKLEDKALQ